MRKKSRARAVLGLTLAAACATLSLVVVPTANAGEAQLDRIVSANPENWTPNVESGRVNALLQMGNKIIAVGKFTTVTKGGVSYTRNNIFAYDATTGALDPAFLPNVGTSEVFDVADAGDGNIFIAGAFSSVNGVAKTKRIAKIDIATGAPVTTFKSPSPNIAVNDIQLSNGRLVIGGGFTTIAGLPRSLMAALNPTTGADTGFINFTFSETWSGGALGIRHFDISDDGSRMVAVGNWRNVNGQSRPQIMMADLSGATATLSPWSTQRFTTTCYWLDATYMRDVDIAPNGQYFVTVTTGGNGGGIWSGTLCDTAARFEIDNTANANPTWIDYTGGDTLTQVKVVDDVIYIGGHQRWLNNPYGADFASQGAVSRAGLAAVDPRNGLPFSWDPTRARGVGVWEFMTTSAGLWVGHDTNLTGGEQRKRLALFPVAGGKMLPTENVGSLPGDVFLFGTGDQVVKRAFDGQTVTSSGTANNGGQTWSWARGAFMVDGVLYTGWADGTFRARTFDGTTFGAAQTVNLNGLSNFAGELPYVTGMFYDKSTARLYFTMAGNPRLFYRYFLPESQIVGAVRFDGPANAGGIDFSNVSSLFLDGSTLYVGSGATGELKSIGWVNSALSGTAQVVSGPGVDGYDWRANGSAILAQ